MKGVVEIATGRVVYLLRDAKITEHGLVSEGDLVAIDVRFSTHDVVDAPGVAPKPWIDGAYAIVDGSWRVLDELAIAEALDAELQVARAAAITRINVEAGQRRAAYITVTTGQEVTYITKEREAKEYLAAETPSPADYPYLAAEAAALGVQLAALAVTVASTSAAWHEINVGIEAVRVSACDRVKKAADVAAVDSIFPVAWP